MAERYENQSANKILAIFTPSMVKNLCDIIEQKRDIIEQKSVFDSMMADLDLAQFLIDANRNSNNRLIDDLLTHYTHTDTCERKLQENMQHFLIFCQNIKQILSKTGPSYSSKAQLKN